MRLAFANFMDRMENYIYFTGFALSMDFFYFTFTGIPGFLFVLEDGLFNILSFNFYENAIAFSLFFFIVLVLNGYLMLSYLGLYGVFSSCLIGVFTFWVSLLINMNDIMINNKITNLVMFKWFTIGNNFTINFEFLIDPVSFSFAFLTTSIALFVNIYAFSYFRYEPNVDRLMLFLNSFVISMVILVLSGNLIMLFLG